MYFIKNFYKWFQWHLVNCYHILFMTLLITISSTLKTLFIIQINLFVICFHQELWLVIHYFIIYFLILVGIAIFRHQLLLLIRYFKIFIIAILFPFLHAIKIFWYFRTFIRATHYLFLLIILVSLHFLHYSVSN